MKQTSLQFSAALSFLSLSVALGAAPPVAVPFGPDDPQAYVMIEEREGMRQGEVVFQRVDLATMTVTPEKFTINKNLWFGHRLPTREEALRTRGESIYKTNNSRFSGRVRPAGDYVMFRLKYLTDGMRPNTACLMEGAPVYRFKPGVANLINDQNLPGGPSDGFKFAGLIPVLKAPTYAQGGKRSDLADAQSVLDETPDIRTRVELAQVIGIYAFKAKDGKVQSCRTTPVLVPATEITEKKR